MPEHQSGADDVVTARLMADPELDGPVASPLAVLYEDLQRFTAIDPAAFQTALEHFSEGRPFVITEDAPRAVLRGCGVRAKLTPVHVSLVHWHEQGWRLMEFRGSDLRRFCRIWVTARGRSLHEADA
ncbi:hypothetical protein ACT4S5_13140 [Kocuria oceani]|uniref:hypothetical protein n=1 Tax=Kocuria oceani TaxID=988827 RepID=UPI004036199E